MKTISRILIMLATAATFFACTKDHSYEDDSAPQLSLYQIAGTWQLSSWNGKEIAADEETYCYLILKSKDSSFEIYQNVDSPYSRHLTGNFKLSYDEDKGINKVSGWYDYNAGLWASDYIVSEVSENSMTWTSGSEVCIYTRCKAIPEDILSGTKGAE